MRRWQCDALGLGLIAAVICLVMWRNTANLPTASALKRTANLSTVSAAKRPLTPPPTSRPTTGSTVKCGAQPPWFNDWAVAKTNNQRELLIYVSELLTDANVTFWLRSGNLLSLVRNSSFTLQNDDDVDFGVLGSDDHKVVALQDRVKADGHTLMVGAFTPKKLLQKNRIGKVFWDEFHGNPACYPDQHFGCFGMVAPTHADLFFMDEIDWQGQPYLNDRMRVSSERTFTHQREDCPQELILPTKQWCIDDDNDGLQTCVAVPKSPKAYLTRMYGANWRTPIRKDNLRRHRESSGQTKHKSYLGSCKLPHTAECDRGCRTTGEWCTCNNKCSNWCMCKNGWLGNLEGVRCGKRLK